MDTPEMRAYRLYYIAGERIVKAEEIHAETEDVAVRTAYDRAYERTVELWDRARRIVRVPSRLRLEV